MSTPDTVRVDRHVRRLTAALLIVTVLAATAAPALAVEEPRAEPSDKSPPVRVYTGETLNLSSVRLSGGGTIGSNTTTFRPVGDGSAFTVDPTSADFDGIEPGSYYAVRDDDTRAELSVVRASVDGIELRDERAATVRVTGDAPTATPIPTAGPTPTPTATPTEGNGPGFGVVAAILALLAAAGVVRRQ